MTAAKRTDSIASEVADHAATNTDDITTLLVENTELTEVIKRTTDLLDELHARDHHPRTTRRLGWRVHAECGHACDIVTNDDYSSSGDASPKCGFSMKPT